MILTEEQLNKADEFLKGFRQFATNGNQISADEITEKAFFLLFIAPSLLAEVREHRSNCGHDERGDRNG